MSLVNMLALLGPNMNSGAGAGAGKEKDSIFTTVNDAGAMISEIRSFIQRQEARELEKLATLQRIAAALETGK